MSILVIKKSGKPFKSGEKVNTVKGVKVNPNGKNELAFTFKEDDSCVNISMCVPIDLDENLYKAFIDVMVREMVR